MGNVESFCSSSNMCSNCNGDRMLSPSQSIDLLDMDLQQTASSKSLSRGITTSNVRPAIKSPQFREHMLREKSMFGATVPNKNNLIAPKRNTADEFLSLDDTDEEKFESGDSRKGSVVLSGNESKKSEQGKPGKQVTHKKAQKTKQKANSKMKIEIQGEEVTRPRDVKKKIQKFIEEAEAKKVKQDKEASREYLSNAGFQEDCVPHKQDSKTPSFKSSKSTPQIKAHFQPKEKESIQSTKPAIAHVIDPKTASTPADDVSLPVSKLKSLREESKRLSKTTKEMKEKLELNLSNVSFNTSRSVANVSAQNSARAESKPDSVSKQINKPAKKLSFQKVTFMHIESGPGVESSYAKSMTPQDRDRDEFLEGSDFEITVYPMKEQTNKKQELQVVEMPALDDAAEAGRIEQLSSSRVEFVSEIKADQEILLTNEQVIAKPNKQVPLTEVQLASEESDTVVEEVVEEFTKEDVERLQSVENEHSNDNRYATQLSTRADVAKHDALILTDQGAFSENLHLANQENPIESSPSKLSQNPQHKFELILSEGKTSSNSKQFSARKSSPTSPKFHERTFELPMPTTPERISDYSEETSVKFPTLGEVEMTAEVTHTAEDEGSSPKNEADIQQIFVKSDSLAVGTQSSAQAALLPTKDDSDTDDDVNFETLRKTATFSKTAFVHFSKTSNTDQTEGQMGTQLQRSASREDALTESQDATIVDASSPVSPTNALANQAEVQSPIRTDFIGKTPTKLHDFTNQTNMAAADQHAIFQVGSFHDQTESELSLPKPASRKASPRLGSEEFSVNHEELIEEAVLLSPNQTSIMFPHSGFENNVKTTESSRNLQLQLDQSKAAEKRVELPSSQNDSAQKQAKNITEDQASLSAIEENPSQNEASDLNYPEKSGVRKDKSQEMESFHHSSRESNSNMFQHSSTLSQQLETSHSEARKLDSVNMDRLLFSAHKNLAALQQLITNPPQTEPSREVHTPAQDDHDPSMSDHPLTPSKTFSSDIKSVRESDAYRFSHFRQGQQSEEYVQLERSDVESVEKSDSEQDVFVQDIQETPRALMALEFGQSELPVALERSELQSSAENATNAEKELIRGQMAETRQERAKNDDDSSPKEKFLRSESERVQGQQKRGDFWQSFGSSLVSPIDHDMKQSIQDQPLSGNESDPQAQRAISQNLFQQQTTNVHETVSANIPNVHETTLNDDFLPDILSADLQAVNELAHLNDSANIGSNMSGRPDFPNENISVDVTPKIVDRVNLTDVVEEDEDEGSPKHKARRQNTSPEKKLYVQDPITSQGDYGDDAAESSEYVQVADPLASQLEHEMTEVSHQHESMGQEAHVAEDDVEQVRQESNELDLPHFATKFGARTILQDEVSHSNGSQNSLEHLTPEEPRQFIREKQFSLSADNELKVYEASFSETKLENMKLTKTTTFGAKRKPLAEKKCYKSDEFGFINLRSEDGDRSSSVQQKSTCRFQQHGEVEFQDFIEPRQITSPQDEPVTMRNLALQQQDSANMDNRVALKTLAFPYQGKAQDELLVSDDELLSVPEAPHEDEQKTGTEPSDIETGVVDKYKEAFRQFQKQRRIDFETKKTNAPSPISVREFSKLKSSSSGKSKGSDLATPDVVEMRPGSEIEREQSQRTSYKSFLKPPSVNTVRRKTFLKPPTKNTFKDSMQQSFKDEPADHEIKSMFSHLQKRERRPRTSNEPMTANAMKDNSHVEGDQSENSDISKGSWQSFDPTPQLIELDLTNVQPMRQSLEKTMNLVKYEISTLDLKDANDQRLRHYLSKRVKDQTQDTLSALQDAIFAANFSKIIRQTFSKLSDYKKKKLALSLKRDAQDMSSRYAERIQEILNNEAGIFNTKSFSNLAQSPRTSPKSRGQSFFEQNRQRSISRSKSTRQLFGDQKEDGSNVSNQDLKSQNYPPPFKQGSFKFSNISSQEQAKALARQQMSKSFKPSFAQSSILDSYQNPQLSSRSKASAKSKPSVKIDAASVLAGKNFSLIQQQIRKIVSSVFAEGDEKQSEIVPSHGDTCESDFHTFLSPSQLEKCLYTLMPILKLDTNRYMIGTLQKQLILKNNNLVIRVGGGFMDFDQYIKQVAKIECLKILKKMEEENTTFQQTLVSLLKQAKASDKMINRFLKDTQSLNVPFAQIVSAVRSKEGEEWIKRKDLQQASAELVIDTSNADDTPVDDSLIKQEEITQRIIQETQDLRAQASLYQDTSIQELSGFAKDEPAAVIAKALTPSHFSSKFKQPSPEEELKGGKRTSMSPHNGDRPQMTRMFTHRPQRQNSFVYGQKQGVVPQLRDNSKHESPLDFADVRRDEKSPPKEDLNSQTNQAAIKQAKPSPKSRKLIKSSSNEDVKATSVKGNQISPKSPNDTKGRSRFLF